MNEKHDTLPLTSPTFTRTTRQRTSHKVSKLFGYIFLALTLFAVRELYRAMAPPDYAAFLETTPFCPQLPEYDPSEALRGREIVRPTVRESVQLLSDAVQIDTTVGDNWPDPDVDDKPWQRGFPEFAAWLQRAFPSFHSVARHETVHRHGQLYTWRGSDPSLKPLLLMAHYDVVPVEPSTSDQWFFPQFSGHIDLERQTVWGRGSVDCKLWLVSALSALDSLAKSHWQPKRTILVSLGFDEESDGRQGAQELSREIQTRYGRNGIAMIGAYDT